MATSGGALAPQLTEVVLEDVVHAYGDVQALALQRALIDGMAMAALEQASASTPLVQAWRQRRQALAPRTVLRIGHLDVLALPPH